MLKHVKLNLQLFAEETIPDKSEDMNLDNEIENEDKKPEGNPFDRLYRKLTGKGEPKEKESEKKDGNDTTAKETTDNKHGDEKNDNQAEKPKADDKESDTKVLVGNGEPEYDEIVYNKEKVKIPVTERQTYLQKGYNYDKVKTAADNANAALLKAAKIEGFNTIEEYLAELDKREKVLLAEKIEEAEGDPDKIEEIVNNHPIVVKTKEERRILEFEKIKSKLSKDRFFKELEPQFDELMSVNPTASPELVYKVIRSDYLTPEKLKELISKEKESVEKRVIADVHDKERRTAPTGGDTNDGVEVIQPSDFTKKLAGIFGVSASKVARRSHELSKRS